MIEATQTNCNGTCEACDCKKVLILNTPIFILQQ